MNDPNALTLAKAGAGADLRVFSKKWKAEPMIDLSLESPISLTEAAKSLPGRPHVCSLHRWRLRGVRGVRLETILIGGRRFTTREALDRFFAATTAASSGGVMPTRTCRQRQRAIEAAERELSNAGI